MSKPCAHGSRRATTHMVSVQSGNETPAGREPEVSESESMVPALPSASCNADKRAGVSSVDASVVPADSGESTST